MGFRGPLRDPNSERGQREGLLVINAENAPAERLKPPKWLSAAQKKLFRELEEQLVAAEVPLKQLDAYAVAMAAKTLELASREADAAKFARLGRDSLAWMAACGATVKSRAQLGIRPRAKAKVDRASAVKSAIFA